jgi:Fe-S cluster biosynthesis and repair protein YggX
MINTRIYHQLCDRYIETFFSKVFILLNENKFEIRSTNNETNSNSLNSNAQNYLNK